MAHYVLIHGAWHGAWCWEKVKPLLASGGAKVSTPNLPSHGTIFGDGGLRRILPWMTNLSDYIAKVVACVEAAEAPVVLVGHSMAGMVITGVAEQVPDRVKKLVYLCAFCPPVGVETALGKLAPEVSPILPSDQRLNLLRGGVGMKAKRVQEIFYHQCKASDVEVAKGRLCLQPLRAFMEPVLSTEANWGRVPKMAIIGEQDAAITSEGQRQMAGDAGITEQVALDSDHSPFFSHPSALAEILLKQGRALV